MLPAPGPALSPIAISTCEGSIAPEEHAAPGRNRQSLQIERDHHRFAFDAVEVNVRGVRHSRRAVAVHARLLDFLQNRRSHAIAQLPPSCSRCHLQSPASQSPPPYPARRCPEHFPFPRGANARGFRHRTSAAAAFPCGRIARQFLAARESCARRCVSRSHPISFTSIGTLPAACTASVWK